MRVLSCSGGQGVAQPLQGLPQESPRAGSPRQAQGRKGGRGAQGLQGGAAQGGGHQGGRGARGGGACGALRRGRVRGGRACGQGLGLCRGWGGDCEHGAHRPPFHGQHRGLVARPLGPLLQGRRPWPRDVYRPVAQEGCGGLRARDTGGPGSEVRGPGAAGVAAGDRTLPKRRRPGGPDSQVELPPEAVLHHRHLDRVEALSHGLRWLPLHAPARDRREWLGELPDHDGPEVGEHRPSQLP
mmetsp:Transcript_60864/g.191356  ORF Transcript_60864/g.191356 Transcript_60864/m.191356 type:complete len:241 (+) Transcript_60864:798-1520(+)